MRVTECLNSEHGVFLTQLGVLETMLEEKASADELRAAMLIVAEPVEKHRAAEESILYPAIMKAFGEGFPPIQVMEAEHAQIVRCIQDVARRSGNVAGLVREFIDILREHIAKEMEVLFPMAERRLGAAELERMAGDCAEHHAGAASGSHCCHGHG